MDNVEGMSLYGNSEEMAQEAHGKAQAPKAPQAHPMAAQKDRPLGELSGRWRGLMDEMPDSIVVKRLVRNLRYRETYVKVYESFLQQEPHPELARLLSALIRVQQSAVVLLSGYLQDLGAPVQDLPPVQKLVGHARSRNSVRSRFHFIHYGLTRAVSWYREQLMDQRMISEPGLKQLLFELGEAEAASLWRTEIAMAVVGVRQESELAESARVPSLKTTEPDRWPRRRPVTPEHQPWTGARPETRVEANPRDN